MIPLSNRHHIGGGTKQVRKRFCRVSCICALVLSQCLLQTLLLPSVNADLDFMTKLKLIGLLALTNKIKLVPLPMPIPFPIHIEGKDEVIYVTAPPMMSSAYSYMSPHHQYKSHGSYGSHGSKYYRQPGSKMYSDVKGYASELVPVVASSDHLPVTTSLRYGDRISSSSPKAQPPRTESFNLNRNRYGPRPARPTHQSNSRPISRPSPPVEYSYQDSRPAPKPETPLPQSEYTYDSVPKSKPHENTTVQIAFIPVKAAENLSVDQQPQEPNSNANNSPDIPESLINYIRQVQQNLPQVLDQAGLSNSENQGDSAQVNPSDYSNESVNKSNSSGDSGVIDSTQTNLPNDKEIEKSQYSQLTQHSVVSEQTPQLALAQAAPVQPVSSVSHPLTPQHQLALNNYGSTVPSIQSHWQSSQYAPSQYHYKPPELKVIRTRYNPQQQQQEQQKYQSSTFNLHNVNSKQTPIVGQDLGWGKPSSAAQPSSYQSLSATPPSQPHQTQFIYSVSHNYQPSTPYYTGQYPSVDNFGLNSYNKHQTTNDQQSINKFTPLAASSSMTIPVWMESEQKSPQFTLNGSFGKRLSKVL